MEHAKKDLIKIVILIVIAVLFFFLWLLQIFTNIDVPAPYPRKMHWTKKFLEAGRRDLLTASEEDDR